MKSRRFGILLVLAIPLLSLAIACGDKQAPPPTPTTGGGGQQSAPAGSPTAPAGKPVSQDEAKQLYQGRCVACHAADGKGRKEVAPKVPDFTDAAWQASKTDDQLNNSITNGIGTGKGAMPKWNTLLKPEEIKGLVDYVRSMKK